MIMRLMTTSCALALVAGSAAADFTLHIIHTNDLHSRIEPITGSDSTCGAEANAAGECFGGVARLITQINALREELDGENVIVLDAGDQYQGSLMFTTYRGEVEAEFMNVIGYDVMAVGNHEFDDGDEGLRKLVDLVDFPVISGNIDVSGSAVLADQVPGHVVLDIGGERVAIVSALAFDTTETASPSDDVIFTPEVESLTADVAALTEEGITKIIALTHVGINKDMEIAQAVPGIDAVVGGHSHTLMSNSEEGAMAYPTMVGDVPVVHAYAYGKYVGHLTLVFDDEGNVTSATGDTILLDASVTEDEAAVARIAELAGPIEEMKTQLVGRTSDDIDGDRNSCRAMECTMGNLIADAMLERVRDQGIVIAIQNGGGIRASISAGDVSMGDVLTVLPFQNTLSTFEVTGETILAALEQGVGGIEDGAGRFPQVAGISFAIDASAPVGERISDVMVGDAPLDPAATYGVVSNNYIRNGGDGYAMFEDAANAYDFGPDLADVLAEYLAEQGDYTPYTDGRITLR
jgi:5'-nucleotidase/UDP-sugar diphosphatase